ncbi:hypothetical protein [Glutamicibacter endophyticus]|uniref:hypothetical protein n=1 Tax=Glutamicibacter endophyticus TaxID=1522174 RepID=UPI003AEF2361
MKLFEQVVVPATIFGVAKHFRFYTHANFLAFFLVFWHALAYRRFRQSGLRLLVIFEKRFFGGMPLSMAQFSS